MSFNTESIINNINKLNKEGVKEIINYPDLRQNDEFKNIINSTPIKDISNNEELFRHYIKNLSINDVKTQLYEYHMLYKEVRDDEKFSSKESIISNILNIVNTYHCIVGGYSLEDNKWNIHTNTSKLFKISEDQIVLSNSMRIKLLYDAETIIFINNLIKCINKYLIGYESKYIKIHDPKKEIYWILIIINKK